jgi:hypothetical protein
MYTIVFCHHGLYICLAFIGMYGRHKEDISQVFRSYPSNVPSLARSKCTQYD